MSTSVAGSTNTDANARTEDECLKNRMQHMIDLQHAHQEQQERAKLSGGPPQQQQHNVGDDPTLYTPGYQEFDTSALVGGGNRTGAQLGEGSNHLYGSMETKIFPVNNDATQQIDSSSYSTPYSTQQHQHNFHYGNPDYHEKFDYHNELRKRRRNNVWNLLSKCCFVLFKPFFKCILCTEHEMQQLKRSFCYGAIDGMLTGSGIVAALFGMNVLSTVSTLSVRIFVVALCGAACVADAVCMALGHVWTTHVLVSANARERTFQRHALEENKADAKGQLVDILLAKGMLKIDAMSLADTLEGYPDLFVSALLGDTLAGGGNGDGPTAINGDHIDGGGYQTDDSFNSPSHDHPSRNTAAGNENCNYHIDGNNNENSVWKFPLTYEQLEFADEEVDSEAAALDAAMRESNKEGIFMMLGFSIFSIVPSLIQLLIPIVFDAIQNEFSLSSKLLHDQVISSTSTNNNESLNNRYDDTGGSGGDTVVFTVVVAVTSLIMWFLGVWKSQFLDSNWALFGVETVVVLLVCVMVAYGLGSLLVHCFPQIRAYNIIVTKSQLIQ